MLLGGCIIFGGILILKAAMCFWTIDGLECINILSDGGREVYQYPINVYEKWFANLFTFIIPIGLVNYYPLLYLLGKVESNNIIYAITPIFTILFLIPCIIIWKIGLKKYESTGS